jgi:cyclic pyranopterin phosphate synthase
MVDVGAKPATHRVAIASGRIQMQPATFRLISSGKTRKGDVLGVARIAAVQAAKRAAELIPLAHPIALTRVAVDFKPDKKGSCIHITARVECRGQTGVEMEALTAAAVAALNVYDLVKGIDPDLVIDGVRLLEKVKGSKE